MNRLLVTGLALLSAVVLSSSAALAAPGTKIDRATTVAADHGQGAKPDKQLHANQGKHLGQTKQHQTTDENAPDDSEGDEESDGERPQNHGWFVSQAAHDQSVTGRDHGKAVSDVARGTAGKPEAAEH